MRNFNEHEVFFFETIARWKKWMDRHQHLPLAMARLGCSSLFVGGWAGQKVHMERAVGQEFASALLAVLFPTRGSECSTLVSEREASYRKYLTADLEGADTDSKKDQLTFGLFSVFSNSPDLMAELQLYAKSARGDVEIGVDQVKGVSSFPFVSGFGGRLYEMFYHRFYFAPIHQQLVESFFSKYDTCARKTDFAELDEVRTGQYSSAESRRIRAVRPTSKQIREAGNRRKSDARALRTRAHAEVPKARDLRKRPLESGHAVLESLEGKRRGRVHSAPTPAMSSVEN